MVSGVSSSAEGPNEHPVDKDDVPRDTRPGEELFRPQESGSNSAAMGHGKSVFLLLSGPLGFGGEGPTSAMEGPKDS